MKLPQTGGCQCGKIRYEISEAPQLVYTCHCTDCQRLTSSAFSMGLVVAETAFRRSGSERIVGLELDHRPHRDAHRPKRVFEQLKLAEKIRVDAVAGLVPVP